MKALVTTGFVGFYADYLIGHRPTGVTDYCRTAKSIMRRRDIIQKVR